MLVHHALKVPRGCNPKGARVLLAGVFHTVVIVTAGLRGLLEAHQRFKLVNYLAKFPWEFLRSWTAPRPAFSNSLVRSGRHSGGGSSRWLRRIRFALSPRRAGTAPRGVARTSAAPLIRSAA